MKTLATLFVFLSLASIFGSTMARYLLVDIGSNDEKMEEGIGSRHVMVSGNICYIKTVSVLFARNIYIYVTHKIFNVLYAYCKQVWTMRNVIQR